MKNRRIEDKIIEDVFIETMSEMVFVNIALTDIFKVNNPVSVKMSILMPYLGDVVVVFSKPLYSLLSENIFGDEEYEGDKVEDAIAEYLNVFTGKLLDKTYSDILFEIGLPEKINFNKMELDGYVPKYFIDPHGAHVALFSRFYNI